MPCAIFVKGSQDLVEHLLIAGVRATAVVEHEHLVERKLQDQVESDEGFAPVVGNEQLLDHLPQRLPMRVALPGGFAFTPEAWVSFLKLAHPVREALDASHLVGGLEQAGHDDAATCSHGIDIGRGHLKPMHGISQHGKHAVEQRDARPREISPSDIARTTSRWAFAPRSPAQDNRAGSTCRRRIRVFSSFVIFSPDQLWAFTELVYVAKLLKWVVIDRPYKQGESTVGAAQPPVRHSFATETV